MAGTTISIIVPTLDRPDHLQRCLSGILRQTIPALEVLIVDASRDADAAVKIASTSLQCSPPSQYCRVLRSDRGSARQRNLGAQHAVGDIFLFCDDDTVLAPNYIEELISAFESDIKIGGAQGVIVEPNRHISPIRFFFALCHGLVFLQWSPARAQRVLISGKYVGFPTVSDSRNLPDSSVPIDSDVQWLSGCCMALRREVFRNCGLQFDEAFERFSGWAYMEDGDLSYRVFRQLGFKLVRARKAQCYHMCGKTAAGDIQALFATKAFNHFYFWRRNVAPSTLSHIAFAWCQVGLAVEAAVRCLLGRNLTAFQGFAMGWREIWKMRAMRS